MPLSLRCRRDAFAPGLGVFALLAVTASAPAAVTYLSQSRTISLTYGTFRTGQPDEILGSPVISAVDLMAWNGTLSNGTTASAFQWSNPGQDTLTLTHEVRSEVYPSGPTSGAWGTGYSTFSMTFQVDQPTGWEFSGAWSYNHGHTYDPGDSVVLTGSTQGVMASMNMVLLPGYSSPNSGALHAGGGNALLLPGETYTLSASIRQPRVNLTRTGASNATLTFTPVPACSTAGPLLAGIWCVSRRRRR